MAPRVHSAGVMHAEVGLFACSCVVAAVLSSLLCRVALRRGWLDRDEGRGSVTYRPVPRVGGIAVVGAVIVAHILGALLGGSPWGSFAPLSWCGALAVFAVGCRDDFRPVSPRLKLMVLLVAGALLALGGDGLRRLPGCDHVLGIGASVVLTSLWIGAVATAWNFVDGLDGIAAGCAAVAGFGLWICGDGGGTAAILTGAAIGFLFHNRHPARIFLGDGGAFFLGFCIAALALRPAAGAGATTRELSSALVVGWPLLDLAWALILRLHRRSLFRASSGHVHYWLSSRLGHRSAALFVVGAAGAGAVAFVFLYAPGAAALTMSCAAGALWLFCMRVRFEQPLFIGSIAAAFWLAPGAPKSFASLHEPAAIAAPPPSTLVASNEGTADHAQPSPMGETLP